MTKKVNRNDPCPCGSGKKHKKCCGKPGLGRHTATVLSSGDVANSLLGRISQAGSAFSTERKIDVMTKGVSLGKPNPVAKKAPENVTENSSETTSEEVKEKKIESAQEND